MRSDLMLRDHTGLTVSLKPTKAPLGLSQCQADETVPGVGRIGLSLLPNPFKIFWPSQLGTED